LEASITDDAGMAAPPRTVSQGGPLLPVACDVAPHGSPQDDGCCVVNYAQGCERIHRSRLARFILTTFEATCRRRKAFSVPTPDAGKRVTQISRHAALVHPTRLNARPDSRRG
jgi:hypothetical protein